MVKRSKLIERIRTALSRSKVTLLSGPRQCGKTTLAREFVPVDSINYFDLEDPVSLARLSEPITALSNLQGLVVIDEIQRAPDLFPILRVLSDRPSTTTTFLVLGSATGALLRQASESLAGRVEVVQMQGFNLGEVQHISSNDLWLKGGFPNSLLARSEEDSSEWRRQFVTTLLERDMQAWGVNVPPTTLRRFWMLIAHYSAQTWNASEPARALGMSQHTIRRYLDIMTDAYMVLQLQPFHANISKRQVRSPKMYISDSGLLHVLLGINTMKDLLTHPKVGASWEGFVISNILSIERPEASWFWSTHGGAEMDLVVQKDGKTIGYEVKRADAPRITPSIQHALNDLQLDEVRIIYPGEKDYQLADNISVNSINNLCAP